jgi:hypothetical protein
VERYRTLAVLAAVVVGAVVGWLIGGGDVATLRAVLDDPATMEAMTDRQVVGVFLPPIVGAVVVPAGGQPVDRAQLQARRLTRPTDGALATAGAPSRTGPELA